MLNVSLKKGYPTSPDTYVFGFVEINSCKAKRESYLAKQNFFARIMLSINKKVLKSSIALILIVILLVNGHALSGFRAALQ